MSTTRIMSYNVYQGGGDRFIYIKELISKVKPDILFIQEACDWFNSGRFDEIKTLLGYDYSNCLYLNSNLRSSSGRIYDMALFSKYPIIESKKFDDTETVWHSLGFVSVQIDYKLNMVLAHLSPKSEDWRLKEVVRINNLLDLNKSEPILLMGDLNSLSSDDDYIDINEKLAAAGISKFGNPPRFEAIDKLKSSGWQDIFNKKECDMSITVREVSEDKDHLDLRLDYIMVNDLLVNKVKSFDIVIGELADKASDHYPVIVDLEV